ncbi:AmmeMemoRadiSam system protein B [Hydrogenimonas cancrithermarum]|uniref:MEMO1 family protein HCR_05340 n=1 Tax=Hydrogenimonas cancrithermarum TaxID=2993563 RepID=A0ABN6WTB2_9BACT|nr:AmmeMemoRadiSam system protein B [Hydrogenimonas cancrithermarum]BDY12222.1 MEMO1 family protein [Hydrogenimonas cancrithermarum]
MRIREAAVAGQFYPASPEEIKMMIDHFNKVLEESVRDPKLLQTATQAVIVPHAGYVYSGFTANIAHRLLGNSGVKRVVVIGPSHRVYLQGTSVSEYDLFETPLGDLPIDRNLATELIQKFGLGFVPEAHHEHSTEVQMPFIKTYLPDARVVELVYGDENPTNLAPVIEWLLSDPQTGVVISTDLSHYYDIEKAKRLDSICLDAVSKLDPAGLHRGCEACGKIGVEAILIAARNLGLEPMLLDYRTSADASGDTSQVVGYMSAAFLKG